MNLIVLTLFLICSMSLFSMSSDRLTDELASYLSQSIKKNFVIDVKNQSYKSNL